MVPRDVRRGVLGRLVEPVQGRALDDPQFDGLWARDDVHEPTDAFVSAYRQRQVYLANGLDRQPALLVHDLPVPVTANRAQVEALAALADLRARGERRAAVIAATGVGKTFLAAFDVLRSGARTALYVSHRLEHLLQARRTFARILPSRTANRGTASPVLQVDNTAGLPPRGVPGG